MPYAALQLCKKYMSTKFKTERRAKRFQTWDMTQKRPRCERAPSSFKKADATQLARDRCAGNAADVGAVDAEVLQFAAGHTAKFGNGLTELAPIVERACYVHGKPLS
jgi:hypothetical protein